MAENKENTPAKPASDSWTKWVALTTTILAVGAAFSTMKGGGFSSQTQLNTVKASTASQLNTVKASNDWAYYQAKSIKQTAMETNIVSLTVTREMAQQPEVRSETEKAIANYKLEVDRYKKEKTEIMEEAKKYEAKAVAESEKYQRKADWSQYRGGPFGKAAMCLQIAIMLCAISALLKKKGAWLAGMCIGVVGLGFLTFGWFVLPDEAPTDWKSPAQVQAAAEAKAAAAAEKSVVQGKPAPAAKPAAD
jgi:hypothetical protein